MLGNYYDHYFGLASQGLKLTLSDGSSGIWIFFPCCVVERVQISEMICLGKKIHQDISGACLAE
jgi:hypothetical protein